ncbi:hypothetical protein HL033_04500 [Neoehrlichia mikurensis]|uniref:Uncharacterized protein n=1 Tax=Neoehrlichia mikurensis TaxID=89586 RepID=A0A9Q9BZL2_9RICK|nr:hypothetical protein [Neoehrlichia mikurensis]QXK91971.1 hypothetical protein IAH97_04500 [Neoehrlichia mikurensis]QXK93185.1 hypothetical protein HUN61_04495 [Neoehrlichia mikurensis]QXK93663.1 hypothetical protein HL033_04500 [Neoehrlichia mikurensis]UTO55380.1 hypothetical protein LUA82_04350 [Neoehrlichia mikurensis]UTO56299.1 hypothetical protein LUA81_04300 [Neoehrlichia mikurensis]
MIKIMNKTAPDNIDYSKKLILVINKICNLCQITYKNISIIRNPDNIQKYIVFLDILSKEIEKHTLIMKQLITNINQNNATIEFVTAVLDYRKYLLLLFYNALTYNKIIVNIEDMTHNQVLNDLENFYIHQNMESLNTKECIEYCVKHLYSLKDAHINILNNFTPTDDIIDILKFSNNYSIIFLFNEIILTYDTLIKMYKSPKWKYIKNKRDIFLIFAETVNDILINWNTDCSKNNANTSKMIGIFHNILNIYCLFGILISLMYLDKKNPIFLYIGISMLLVGVLSHIILLLITLQLNELNTIKEYFKRNEPTILNDLMEKIKNDVSQELKILENVEINTYPTISTGTIK